MIKIYIYLCSLLNFMLLFESRNILKLSFKQKNLRPKIIIILHKTFIFILLMISSSHQRLLTLTHKNCSSAFDGAILQNISSLGLFILNIYLTLIFFSLKEFFGTAFPDSLRSCFFYCSLSPTHCICYQANTNALKVLFSYLLLFVFSYVNRCL